MQPSIINKCRHGKEKKRKDYTFNLMRGQVLYQAAQNIRKGKKPVQPALLYLPVPAGISLPCRICHSRWHVTAHTRQALHCFLLLLLFLSPQGWFLCFGLCTNAPAMLPSITVCVLVCFTAWLVKCRMRCSAHHKTCSPLWAGHLAPCQLHHPI